MSILDSEEVCVELIREHASQEYVKEVLQISSDGSTVRPSPARCQRWLFCLPGATVSVLRTAVVTEHTPVCLL